MQPIVLTEFDEMLLPDPAFGSNDDSKLELSIGTVEIIGTHDVCRGNVEIKVVSLTHCVILCRECHLRIPIPREVNTYGKLRAYLEKQKIAPGQIIDEVC
jgi:hypothetical protein